MVNLHGKMWDSKHYKWTQKSLLIWVNYNMSLTWILRPSVLISLINHDSRVRENRVLSWRNLPRLMDWLPSPTWVHHPTLDHGTEKCCSIKYEAFLSIVLETKSGMCGETRSKWSLKVTADRQQAVSTRMRTRIFRRRWGRGREGGEESC